MMDDNFQKNILKNYLIIFLYNFFYAKNFTFKRFTSEYFKF